MSRTAAMRAGYRPRTAAGQAAHPLTDGYGSCGNRAAGGGDIANGQLTAARFAGVYAHTQCDAVPTAYGHQRNGEDSRKQTRPFTPYTESAHVLGIATRFGTLPSGANNTIGLIDLRPLWNDQLTSVHTVL